MIVDITSTIVLGRAAVKYITLDTIYANLCALKALFGLSIMRFMRLEIFPLCILTIPHSFQEINRKFILYMYI